MLEPARLTGDLILSIRRSRRPVVAALDGTVAGAGAVIAAASNIGSRRRTPRSPSCSRAWGWPAPTWGRVAAAAHRRNGPCERILMLGDFISAERAAEIRLYNRVVPGERDGGGGRVRHPLGQGTVVALGVTEQALNEEAAIDLVAAIEWEARAQADSCRLQLSQAYEAFRASASRGSSRHADAKLVRAFPPAAARALTERARRFTTAEIAGRAEPQDDAAARVEARTLLGLLGAGGWLQPIFDLDLRGCCLMREALGEARHSPTRCSPSRASAPRRSCSAAPRRRKSAGSDRSPRGR